MTPEDELAFACIRQDIDLQREKILALCRNPALDWEVFYSITSRHGVSPLVYSNLRQCDPDLACLPTETLAKFEQDLYHSLAAQEIIAEKTAQALARLNQAHVETMLVKGAALKFWVYAQPWYTILDDVDLVLRVREAELTDPSIPEFLRHFEEEGIQFEFDFLEHHDITMNGQLSVDFDRIWRDACPVDLRGRAAWIMCPEDMLIASCINSCRKRFFGLKALRDISEIVRHYPELRWGQVCDKARAYSGHNQVYAALLVAKMMVGCSIPDEVFLRLGVLPARAALIRFLIRKQSFASLSSLNAGVKLLGRRVGWGLILSYMTYPPNQLWRRMRFVYERRQFGSSRASQQESSSR